jgi:hypothetical protein
MNSHVRSICHGRCLFSASEALRNSLLRYEEIRRINSIRTRFCADLARILLTEIAKVSAPKNKEKAPAAGESGNQRPKRRKDKLIRLDDLIPEKDVKGGRQLPFGVTDTPQRQNNPNK